MSTEAMLALIAACASVLAIVSNITGLRARGRETNPALVEIRQDIKYIRSTLDRHEGSNGELARRVDDQGNRLAAVEQSVHSAHKRIDDMTRRGA